MKTINVVLLLFCFLFTKIAESQDIFGPDTANYKRYAYKTGSNPTAASELLYNNNVMFIGNDGSTKYRAFYQWNLTDNVIPNGSQIDTVEIFFTYTPFVSTHYIAVGYSDVGEDLKSPDVNSMWNRSDLGSSYQIGSGQGNKYGFQGSQQDTVLSTFGPSSDFCIAVQNALSSDKFTLGLTSNTETYPYEWQIDNSSFTIRIVYRPPSQNIIVDQKLSNNARIDSVGLWNPTENKFDNFGVPGSFPWTVNSSKILRGSQKLLNNQKYVHWENNSQVDNDIANHKIFEILPTTTNLTSRFNPSYQGITIKNSLEGTQIDPESDSIKFADPWYIDYADPDYADSVRNRGMKLTGSDPDKLQYRERASPFYPNYNTIYQNGNDPSHAYQGVFLNQDPNFLPNVPNYSVQALSSQPVTLTGIGTRDFYFFSWDYDENKISLQDPLYATTGVVFKDANATLTANLKGHLLSNNQNALSGGSQRRLVRTDNGIYHLVYESMGVIWYTHSNSTNFNGSWSAEAGVEIGKNPSMDFNYNTVRIVCEKSDADSSIIEMITIDPDYNNPLEYEYEDVIHFPLSYYGNAKPVISTGSVLTYIAYRKNVADGIHQVCRFYQGIWDDQLISGTNADCMNPSIAGAGEDIHLVCANNSRIEYIFCYKKNAWEYHSPEYISDGSGNNANGNPCITLANGYPFVSWIGSYSSTGITKGTAAGGGDIPPMVVARRKGSTWGSFFKSGSNVFSVNSNSSNNSTEQTVIAWSEGTPQSYTSNWVRRVDTAYSDPHNLSSNGVQTQVSNGTDLTDMGSVLLSTATTPYDLPLLTTDFNQLFLGGPGGTGKIKNQPDLAYGREGIISKNGVEFLFDIGDVIVGDSVIKFIYRPDTLSYASSGELNEVVRTESFPLDPSAEFYFTDFYYVLNPGAADTLLSGDDLVSFKAELVDAGSGSIAGTFDNVTYTKEQLTEHNNVSYRVDCSNITPGSYYLRLVTTVQGEAEYSLADVQNNADELAKHSYNEIVYDGTKLPETYDLSQNFPNPFNPATTINYQMPENGFVTLKIYDILGKEVATLVNEQKNQGRYSVNFDASRLASGVYIYQLRVNDYVSSKKMLLLK